MQQEYDRINVVFEISHDFVDGDIERTRIEKDTSIVPQLETTVGKVIDIFVEFMNAYGFNKEVVKEAFKDYIEYE